MRGWAARRPVWVLSAVALLGAAGVGSGGYYAYQTYDWVQHDNDFCLSCHLMQQPYQLFAQSAHRGLGCKACHHPTFAARSQMALTQIIEQPDSLATHAEVPNEKCASCHIEGDPEKWEVIANTAGHRVHLESDDPSLQGLQCVQCHSTSLHQFAATDETCAQSGCHTDVKIQLGKMGNFTIHCVACHSFNAPVEAQTSVTQARAVLAPTSNECLSCHVMRTLVDIPPDEPHRAVCSTCHNPHTQTTPHQAVETCAQSGCHDNVETLSPFHRGLNHRDVEDCTTCHKAHTFRVQGDDCLACHQDIFQRREPGAGDSASATPGRTASAAPVAVPAAVPMSDPVPGVRFATLDLTIPPGLYRHGARSSGDVAVRESPAQATPGRRQVVFQHADHRTVACTECHSSSDRHGAVKLQGIQDCRSCHHQGPTSNQCQNCHVPGSLNGTALSIDKEMDLSVAPQPIMRELPFDHGNHQRVECSTCHGSGLQRPVDQTACNSCHEDHHQATAQCTSCHVQPPASAHTATAHVGCTGSACHVTPPFQGVPRQRNACLVCHQAQQDHQPGRECVVCHVLPDVPGGTKP